MKTCKYRHIWDCENYMKIFLICDLLLAFIFSCSSSDPAQITPPIGPGLADWAPLSTTGPPMKTEFSMVYAAFHEQIIAFGGRDKNFDNVNETWAYDYKAKTWTNLQPAFGPLWRANHAMIYDPARNKTVMFGGDDFTRSFNDLWEYDYGLNTWTELSPNNPPAARQMHGMVYDTEHEVVIMFGGRRTGGGAAFNDTWEYNHATNSWRSLHPLQSPPIQDHVNLAYDEMHQKTILFSGPINHNRANIGTWVYDYQTNNWSTLNAENSPTGDHSSFIYNPNRGKSLLFGNTDAGNAMETWIFDYASNDWTLIASPELPSYREHFGMAYNEAQDAFILIGGFPNNDSWLLRVNE